MAGKSKAGHRQRLRERFLAGAQGSHSQERLLELLLTFAIARKDVRPIAQELIRVFGSLSEVLSAFPNELSKVKGVGQSSVALLKAIDSIRSYLTTHKSKCGQDKRLDSTEPMLFEASPEKIEAEIERPALSSQPKNIESKSTYQKSARRKFQVSNGYLLEFDQLARILHFLLENRDARKINRIKIIMNAEG